MASGVRWGMAALAALALACNVAWAQTPLADQYPKPLIHTPADHPAARVVIVNVEGMHAIDLAEFVGEHPQSTLAELSRRGVTYTNAHAPWAGAAAGLVGLLTGGTPISTGIVSDDGYDRGLSPAGSRCRTKGAALPLHGKLDVAALPLDGAKGCTAVWPHDLLRVNTIFEVVREKVGRTAWAEDNASRADLLRGASGKGLDESCGFHAGENDQARVRDVLHWIDGKDCAGTRDEPVPALFGMSFSGFAEAQRSGGYVDHGAKPSDELAKSFMALDEALGRMVQELKAKRLYESTWIVVTAAYGQAPMDRARLRKIDLRRLSGAAGVGVAHVSGGDVAMIWLRDPAETAAAVEAFGRQSAALRIQEIYDGRRLGLTLNLPERDPRMPDIVLQPELGVLWVANGDTASAGLGGMSDEDTHVALLVSGSQLTGRQDKTWVPSTQLAPLLLRALGMEKFDLQALHPEHTPALPGIF